MYAERFLGVKSQRIIPGHKQSCSFQKPSLQDPSWLSGVHTQGRVLRQINQGRGQSKTMDLMEDKSQKTAPFKEFKLPKGVTLSQPAHAPFCMHFSKAFFTLYLVCPHLNSFLTRQARTRDTSPHCRPLWSSG